MLGRTVMTGATAHSHSSGRRIRATAPARELVSHLRRRSWYGLPEGFRSRHRPAAENLFLKLVRQTGQPFGHDADRVYTYHIRKTGGTSLHRAFMALGGEDPIIVERRVAASLISRAKSGPYTFAAGNPRVIASGKYSYAWSHRCAEDLRLPGGTFTVSIFRDPLRRVISYYEYLIEGDSDDITYRVGAAERALARDGFSEFLARVPKRDLLPQLFMFSRAYSVGQAVDAAGRCSFIFCLERYDEGIASLAQQLGVPLKVRSDRITRHRADIPAAALDRLREMLEPEYDFFRQLGIGSGPP